MASEVILLCEDSQQEVFVRRWLIEMGVSRRSIRPEKSPPGRGAGVAFVRDSYVEQVRELRKDNSHRPVGAALVAVIDADTRTLQQRQEELDRILRNAGEPNRQDDERIAVLVPKRNIETWIHHLRGEQVNEEDSYRKLENPGECRADVKRFVEEPITGPLHTQAPPSLRSAVAEMERIV